MLWRRVPSKSQNKEYKNINSNKIKITGSNANQGIEDSDAKFSQDKLCITDIITAKHELQEVKKSIDAVRDRLNKIAGQGERLELTEEIIDVSRQLDILIQDYNRRIIEIQKMSQV